MRYKRDLFTADTVQLPLRAVRVPRGVVEYARKFFFFTNLLTSVNTDRFWLRELAGV